MYKIFFLPSKLNSKRKALFSQINVQSEYLKEEKAQLI